MVKSHLRLAIERRNSKFGMSEPFAGAIHDFSVPMAKRAESRKVVGPYYSAPRKVGSGIGFYMGSDGQMAKHGAGIRLRIEEANDHLRGSRLSHVNGYYCDDFESDTLQPIIARLPKGRGFLAGWTMGEGMCASLDSHIWPDEAEAARAAHGEAERDAERQRDCQAEETEKAEQEERADAREAEELDEFRHAMESAFA